MSAVTSAPPGCAAGASGSPRSWTRSTARSPPRTHARGSVLARHPRQQRFDAFWLAGGRVADWAALETAGDIHGRTVAALLRAGVGGATTQLPADAVAEARIVQTWLAAHGEVPALQLAPAPGELDVARFVAAATNA